MLFGLTARSGPDRVKISGRRPGDSGAVCMTMHTGAGKSAGSAAVRVRSASIPPAEAPITTMCLGAAMD
jgi:hypothetical protein